VLQDVGTAGLITTWCDVCTHSHI